MTQSGVALAAACATGFALGLAAARVLAARHAAQRWSEPNQTLRFARAVRSDDVRQLHVERLFRGEQLAGKRVLVVGATRGLGLALARELVACGAEVLATSRSASESPELAALGPRCREVRGVEVGSAFDGAGLLRQVGSVPLDVVIANAGYFFGPVERLDSLDFAEELKMIDICALGPLRIVAALSQGGLLCAGARVAVITSQAGSIAWREVQNPAGDNYGHHASRAACNMNGRLLSFELRARGVAVALLHPGFNRTDMTAKYAAIWDAEGAVAPEVGAKRVLHEVNSMSLARTGRFINCEDGKEIPW
jgi:NAD(P)-dependent dehydrogenase (short-subunit alcohol dehydrogenase family)